MLTLNEIHKEVNGTFFNAPRNFSFEKVSTDTRTLKKGDIFIALRGTKFDGHQFVKEAFEKGAQFCIVDTKVPVSCLVVKDTLEALGNIARAYRRKFKIPIVGITGSNGKTTTKDMVASLLAQKFVVHKSKANFNNLIGVPLTLLNLKKDHQAAVVEMGTNQLGEIKRLTEIVEPTLGVITHIGIAHLEGLKNLEEIFKEKIALFEFLHKKEHHLIVNIDDPFLAQWAQGKNHVTSVSLERKADIYTKNFKVLELGKTSFEILLNKDTIPVVLNVGGKHHVRNVLLAVGVAHRLGVKLEDIENGLSHLTTSPGRCEIHDLGRVKILDDTYNANPDSMRASLEYLSEAGKTLGFKTVAILGDMFELGYKTKKFHQEIGRFISQLKIHTLYTLGEYSQEMIGETSIQHTQAGKQPIDIVNDFIKRLDQPTLVLVKGSRGMKMEVVVELLKQKLKKG
ncbi:MAG: UDP-N-acetylmuramoyl-tripeptide--D-alanyl-D-alanine ligase [Deltaproteobacteria bacterium]|nr:UDP-N-acetylmuramoyl-tripeptide--D-alanyl-D-alanine ligase [Deltaproteobacteria bacterium]